MQFYARKGDFPAGGNLGPGIGQINLSTADQTALVAFLRALSDDRVRYERAPFDHPSVCVSTGATELSPVFPRPLSTSFVAALAVTCDDVRAGKPEVGISPHMTLRQSKVFGAARKAG